MTKEAATEEAAGFPPDFLWGVATAAFQIEGATREDGRGPSIWDTFCATPGRVENGDTGEVACDHYHRWESDLDLIASLGVQSYRFSVAWPRIFPEGTGRVNEKGLDFYDRLVDGMLARGLRPNATLYHWDLPQALQDRGGWGARDTAYAFADYAEVVTRRLGDRLAFCATFNEPWCIAILSHAIGEHAPGLRNPKLALQVAHNLYVAHGLALPRLRANAPGAEHGIVLNFTPSYPASEAPEDEAAAARFDGFFNRWFLDPLLKGSYPQDLWEGYGDAVPVMQEGDLELFKQPLDFLGVNYYSRAVVAHAEGDWPNFKSVPAGEAHTDMGWEVFPQGLTDLLVRLKRDYPLPPLYITENGAAYPDQLQGGRVVDSERTRYYALHLTALQEALRQGVDVRGYYAWSLMDNFEWAKGYSKRFGLVYVDYATQERTLKESGRWYQGVIRSSGAVLTSSEA